MLEIRAAAICMVNAVLAIPTVFHIPMSQLYLQNFVKSVSSSEVAHIEAHSGLYLMCSLNVREVLTYCTVLNAEPLPIQPELSFQIRL